MRSMNRFIALLLLLVTPLLAEEVTLKQPVVLKADRSIVSLKPGTVVELVSRDGNEITLKYRNFTGKIPASKLDEPKSSPPVAKSAPPAKSAPAAKATPEKRTEKKPAETKPAETKPANPPQTIYGKAVQKAKDNAAAHDKNLVKPTDEVLKDRCTQRRVGEAWGSEDMVSPSGCGACAAGGEVRWVGFPT
jgi:hypothetical protein